VHLYARFSAWKWIVSVVRKFRARKMHTLMKLYLCSHAHAHGTVCVFTCTCSWCYIWFAQRFPPTDVSKARPCAMPMLSAYRSATAVSHARATTAIPVCSLYSVVHSETCFFSSVCQKAGNWTFLYLEAFFQVVLPWRREWAGVQRCGCCAGRMRGMQPGRRLPQHHNRVAVRLRAGVPG
jgi:hypothetical protein